MLPVFYVYVTCFIDDDENMKIWIFNARFDLIWSSALSLSVLAESMWRPTNHRPVHRLCSFVLSWLKSAWQFDSRRNWRIVDITSLQCDTLTERVNFIGSTDRQSAPVAARCPRLDVIHFPAWQWSTCCSIHGYSISRFRFRRRHST